MTPAEKKKVITTNAMIWTVGMLLSFILPLIAESITEGRGNFLKAMMHIFPLIVAMGFSTALINKAVGQPAE